MKRIRLSLEVDHEVKDRIDRIQKRTGATSLTEVVRRALRLYEVVLENTEKPGSRLVVEREFEVPKREVLNFI